MQLKSARDKEAIAWIKIMENILIVVDPAKLEKSTGGEWRSTLCRSLTLLLPHDEPGMIFSWLSTSASNSIYVSASTAVFALMISAALRLSLLPGPSAPHLSLLVDRLLQTLKHLEKETTPPVPYRKKHHAAESQMPPLHGALRLFETPSGCNPVEVWGEGVEALWQITMTIERKSPAWDALTCRLLLWRAMVGEDGSTVGEWARKEVVRNLRTQ
jgi:nucleolar pre-ribosomal-associated protein 1